MFIPFFLALKAEKIPVTLREFLTLLDGLKEGIATFDVEAFYYLARAAPVKDERHIDRFDRVFAQRFRGLAALSAMPDDGGPAPVDLPAEWLARMAEKVLS